MIKRIQCTVIDSVPLQHRRVRKCAEPRDSDRNDSSLKAVSGIDTAAGDHGYSFITTRLNDPADSPEDGPSPGFDLYSGRIGIAQGIVLDFLA